MLAFVKIPSNHTNVGDNRFAPSPELIARMTSENAAFCCAKRYWEGEAPAEPDRAHIEDQVRAKPRMFLRESLPPFEAVAPEPRNEPLRARQEPRPPGVLNHENTCVVRRAREREGLRSVSFKTRFEKHNEPLRKPT